VSGDDVGRAVEQVLDRVAAVRWDDLDAGTRDATLRGALDALGVAAGGVVAPGVEASLAAYARAGGRGEVVVAWCDVTLPPADAAMALSLLVHAWDFDDTHDDAVVHAFTVALPAALAVAQSEGRSGRDLLAGVVAGVEVLCRLSLAVGVQPGVIRTAGLGSLGAAAAAARTLGLDGDGMRRALSLALPVAMSPTSRQVVVDGAISKRHQPGFAARHGVTAAHLAAAGVAGPEGWFTGDHGLSAFVADRARAAAELTRPGWEVTRLSLKPYPACRYTHAAVDAVLELTGGRPAPEVARVEVHVPVGIPHALVARPWARRGQPVVDAQFSIPWLVGAALQQGRVDLQTVAGPALLDPAVEARARRVEVVQDQYPGRSLMTPVRVVVTGSDGGERSRVVQEVPGSPARPLSWDAVQAKAEGCLRAAGRDPGLARVLRETVAALPDLDPRQALLRLAAPAPPPTAPRPRTQSLEKEPT
jgi:2-methylcitrate dehydratase PrpD